MNAYTSLSVTPNAWLERAHDQGVFTDTERTLLVGNARALIERLGGGPPGGG